MAVDDGDVRAELVEWCAIVAERRGGRDDRNPRLWLADVTEQLSRPFGAGAVAGEALEELRRAVTAADAALAAARPQPEMVHPDDEMLTLLDNYSTEVERWWRAGEVTFLSRSGGIACFRCW